jgi:thioredoxin reductase (NADPH)
MHTLIDTDVLVVGAGPVGLFSVFEAGLLDLKCHLVDILDRPGGQCTEFYPEKMIYDIPSVPVCTGQQLVDNLLRQIRPFSPEFHFSQLVEEVSQESDRWRIRTDEGTTFRARVLVIAAGAGSFTPRRPPIKDIGDYEPDGVQYAIKRKDTFRDKRLVIAGGGDSAIDWVLNLHDIARHITLVHRRPEFRAAPDSVKQVMQLVQSGKVAFLPGECDALEGKSGSLQGVTVKLGDGERRTIAADHLLPFFGLTMKLGPIAKWGLNLHENRIVVDPERFETSVSRVFAIGDINFYPGKLKLILSGFHEAALMAHAAFRYCRPEKRLVFQYTTTSTALKQKLDCP